jgi:hypothetical protein
MTLRGSADVGFILLAGYDVMGLITNLDEVNEAILEQSDGLGDASDEWSAVGISKFDLSFDGFYDDALIQAIEAIAGEMVLFYSLVSNTIGDRCVGVNAIRSTITRGPARDALTKAQIAFKSDEGPDVGQISAAHGAVTAVGPVEGTSDDWGTQAAAVSITSSSVDNPAEITMAAVHGLTTGDTVLIAGHDNSDLNGIFTATVINTTVFSIPVDGSISGPGGAAGTVTLVSSRDGGVGYLQVSALDLDGGTNIVIIIKDSDDDITFNDLITFTAVTSAPDAERATVADQVERYTLTEHEFTGGAGGSRTSTFATGFVRN